MSMYRGHLLGGMAAYLMMVLILGICKSSFHYYFFGLLATLAGSLFPDIDIYSQGQKLFLKLLLLVLILCLFLQASLPIIALLCFSILPILFPHRGLFHNLIFILFLVALAMGSLIYLLPQKVEMILVLTLFFIGGVISHLVLDKGVKKTFYKR